MVPYSTPKKKRGPRKRKPVRVDLRLVVSITNAVLSMVRIVIVLCLK